MPNTSRGRDSRKNNGPKAKELKGKSGCAGGMIDVLSAFDTRYPDIHAKRKGTLRGNGPTPGNPFGRKFPRPRVGKGGP